MLTENEFHDAFSNLSFESRLPEEYWERQRYAEEHHPLVGKRARITVPNSTICNQILTVIRANDRIKVFGLPNGGELIVSQFDIDNGYQFEWID